MKKLLIKTLLIASISYLAFVVIYLGIELVKQIDKVEQLK